METILILLTHPSADFSVKNDTGETALEIATRASKFNRLFEITEENLNQI
jgi:ankyrin repeat protein